MASVLLLSGPWSLLACGCFIFVAHWCVLPGTRCLVSVCCAMVYGFWYLVMVSRVLLLALVVEASGVLMYVCSSLCVVSGVLLIVSVVC